MQTYQSVFHILMIADFSDMISLLRTFASYLLTTFPNNFNLHELSHLNQHAINRFKENTIFEHDVFRTQSQIK